MKTVVVIISGLPEHEGREFVDFWGRGNGDTLQEVCIDIAIRNPDKAKYLNIVDENTCYYWGMKLQLLTED